MSQGAWGVYICGFHTFHMGLGLGFCFVQVWGQHQINLLQIRLNLPRLGHYSHFRIQTFKGQ